MNMRTKSKLLGGLAGALILSTAGEALAYEGFGFSGGMCHQEVNVSDSRHGYHNYPEGPTRGPLFDVPVSCPISYPLNAQEFYYYNTIQLYGRDDSSTFINQCFPSSYNAQGGIDFIGPTKRMCNAAGGCSTSNSDSSFVGNAVLTWAGSDAFLGARVFGTPIVFDYSSTGLFCTFGGTSEVHGYRFYK
jgi:hypothetical protein